MRSIACFVMLLFCIDIYPAEEADEGIYPLLYAVCSLNTAMVKHLLKRAKIEERDAFGRTALFLAIEPRLMGQAADLPADKQRESQREIVQLLQSRGASLNVVDNNGVSLRSLLDKEENYHFNEVLTLDNEEEEKQKHASPRQKVMRDGITVKQSAAIPIPARAKKNGEWYES